MSHPDRPDAARLAAQFALDYFAGYTLHPEQIEGLTDLIAAYGAQQRAEGEAAGAALAWTKEKPTKPGWYVNFYRGRRPYRIYEFTQADLDEGCLLHRDGLDEWYGPIPEPSARAQAGRGEG